MPSVVEGRGTSVMPSVVEAPPVMPSVVEARPLDFARGDLASRKLQRMQLCIKTAMSEQLLVRAYFCHFTMMQDNNAVGALDR